MVGIAPVFLTRRFSSSQMFSIMYKSGDFFFFGGGGGGGGGKSTTFSLFAFRYAQRGKIQQFPGFLVHFVLLLLLSFIVACFFETISTFYQ